MGIFVQAINEIAPYWINSIILLAIIFVITIILIVASQFSKSKKKVYTGILYILAYVSIVLFDIVGYITLAICLCRIIQFFL